MLRARALTVSLFVLLVGGQSAALAHDPGLSALEVRVARSRIEMELSIAPADAAALDRKALERAIEVTLDDRPLPVVLSAIGAEDAGVRVQFVSDRAAGTRLFLRSSVLPLLPRGHRQLVTIRDAQGILLGERMLDGSSSEMTVELAATLLPFASAGSFFLLGVEHIAGGYDHVLFLVALLLTVRGAADAVRTVTAFTAAHSLTLAATVLGWVEVPPVVVEPLIAASIMYVAAENMMRADMGSRWKLTFAFGLVHGFGFAGALRDLGIGHGDARVALPLAAFNLGVEAGQVAIAGVLLPLVARVRTYSTWAGRLATAGSAVVFLAGGYWFVERLS